MSDRNHTDERLDVLLNDALDTRPLTTSAVRARVLERISSPSDPWNRLMNWLTEGPLLVRPAVLALVPLALGFALGFSFPAPGAGEATVMEAADLVAFVSIEDYTNEQ
jgi:hypothetical protein